MASAVHPTTLRRAWPFATVPSSSLDQLVSLLEVGCFPEKKRLFNYPKDPPRCAMIVVHGDVAVRYRNPQYGEFVQHIGPRSTCAVSAAFSRGAEGTGYAGVAPKTSKGDVLSGITTAPTVVLMADHKVIAAGGNELYEIAERTPMTKYMRRALEEDGMDADDAPRAPENKPSLWGSSKVQSIGSARDGTRSFRTVRAAVTLREVEERALEAHRALAKQPRVFVEKLVADVKRAASPESLARHWLLSPFPRDAPRRLEHPLRQRRRRGPRTRRRVRMGCGRGNSRLRMRRRARPGSERGRRRRDCPRPRRRLQPRGALQRRDEISRRRVRRSDRGRRARIDAGGDAASDGVRRWMRGASRGATRVSERDGERRRETRVGGGVRVTSARVWSGSARMARAAGLLPPEHDSTPEDTTRTLRAIAAATKTATAPSHEEGSLNVGELFDVAAPGFGKSVKSGLESQSTRRGTVIILSGEGDAYPPAPPPPPPSDADDDDGDEAASNGAESPPSTSRDGAEAAAAARVAGRRGVAAAAQIAGRRGGAAAARVAGWRARLDKDQVDAEGGVEVEEDWVQGENRGGWDIFRARLRAEGSRRARAAAAPHAVCSRRGRLGA